MQSDLILNPLKKSFLNFLNFSPVNDIAKILRLSDFFFEAHCKEILALIVTYSGKYLISGSFDSTIRIWNIKKCSLKSIINAHENCVSSLCITKNDFFLVSGSWDCSVKVWELNGGKIIGSFKKHSDKVRTVKLLKDDKFVISASTDNTIRMWSLFDQIEKIKIISNNVSCIVLSNDEKFVIAACGKILNIWDLETADFDKTIADHDLSIICIALTMESILTGSCDKLIKQWSFTGEAQYEYAGHSDAITDLGTLSNYLISISADQTIRIWDLTTKAALSTVLIHSNPILSLTISNNLIITSSCDRTIRISQFSELLEKSNNQMKIFPGHTKKVKKILITKNQKYIITSAKDNSLRIWNFSNKVEEKVFLYGNYLGLCVFKVTNDDKYLAFGTGNGKVKVWNLKKKRMKIAFFAGKKKTIFVEFSRDNLLLLAGSDDGKICVWNVKEKSSLWSMRFKGLEIATFSENMKFVLVGTGEIVRIWDFDREIKKHCIQAVGLVKSIFSKGKYIICSNGFCIRVFKAKFWEF